MLKTVASFVFLAIILYSCAEAQMISTEVYETEEDLQTGLELGLLTYDQYLELLDMIQSKVTPTSEDADKLEFVPDVSNADVSQIKERREDIDLQERAGPFLEKDHREAVSGISGKLVWRLYQRFQETDQSEHYLSCEVQNGDRMIWHVEADQQWNSSEAAFSRSDLRVRKRYVKFLLPEYSGEVIVGNFDRRIGLGLNIGYHPLFGYSSLSDVRFDDSFLYPALGRNNGILGEGRLKSISLLVFYSKYRRQEIDDQVSAIDLSFVNKRMQVGFCLSEGKLKNTDNQNTFNDDCQSLHFDLKLKPLRFSGEYALLSNKKAGLAFDLYSARKKYSFDFSGWRYDDDFVHPHGSGISNQDYETIDLEKIDFQYRSRQAGERGILFKSRYDVFNRVSLNFSYNQWRERSYLPGKTKLRVGAGYEFSHSFSLAVYQLWTDYEVEDRQIDERISSLNLLLSPRRNLDLDLIGNYRSTADKEHGDIKLKAGTKLLSPFDIILWLRYYDPNFSQASDGYFSFQIQEKVRFLENYFVSAEFITKFYQGEDQINTQAARIRIEAVW
ncbi:MAG: hypothetical protein WCE90_06220 [Candidatus Zixiibacteriota bacterium]